MVKSLIREIFTILIEEFTTAWTDAAAIWVAAVDSLEPPSLGDMFGFPGLAGWLVRQQRTILTGLADVLDRLTSSLERIIIRVIQLSTREYLTFRPPSGWETTGLSPAKAVRIILKRLEQDWFSWATDAPTAEAEMLLQATATAEVSVKLRNVLTKGVWGFLPTNAFSLIRRYAAFAARWVVLIIRVLWVVIVSICFILIERWVVDEIGPALFDGAWGQKKKRRRLRKIQSVRWPRN